MYPVSELASQPARQPVSQPAGKHLVQLEQQLRHGVGDGLEAAGGDGDHVALSGGARGLCAAAAGLCREVLGAAGVGALGGADVAIRWFSEIQGDALVIE